MPPRPPKKRRSRRKHVDEDEELLDLHIPPSMDTGVAQTMTSIAQMERCIAKILLLRYQQDIARLFSTRIHNIALVYLPKLIHHCVALSGPAWIANNADSEDLKDFFRAALAMDLRQSGERVATKSVLWSYTAIRHFVSRRVTPTLAGAESFAGHLPQHSYMREARIAFSTSSPLLSTSKGSPPLIGSVTTANVS